MPHLDSRRLVLLAGLLLAFASAAKEKAVPFADPLDTPAHRVGSARKVTELPLVAIAKAGQRLIAVGSRGLIVMSDDQGKSWTQMDSPVQSDLADVQFIDDQTGWIVGHDALVLKSVDGGKSWEKQFDLRTMKVEFPAYYENLIQAGDTEKQRYLEQVNANIQGDSALPFVSVCFLDRDRGYAVGTFGQIAMTLDGGRHWLPASHLIDNPEQLNLNAIRRVGGALYIAGERGMVYRHDREAGRFIAVDTGYKGSLFDIVGKPGLLLAFGLRGTAYSSRDDGTSWTAVTLPTTSALFSGGTLPGTSDFYIVTEEGEVLRASSEGGSGKPLTRPGFATAASLPLDDGRLALVGYGGVRIQQLAR